MSWLTFARNPYLPDVCPHCRTVTSQWSARLEKRRGKTVPVCVCGKPFEPTAAGEPSRDIAASEDVE